MYTQEDKYTVYNTQYTIYKHRRSNFKYMYIHVGQTRSNFMDRNLPSVK